MSAALHELLAAVFFTLAMGMIFGWCFLVLA